GDPAHQRGRDRRDRLPDEHLRQDGKDGRRQQGRQHDGARGRLHARLLNQAREPRAGARARNHLVDAGQRPVLGALHDRSIEALLFEDRVERHLAEPLVEPARLQQARQLRRAEIGADDPAGDEHEDEEREHHHRTSVTPSNMSAGRWMPDAFRRSQHFGRTPVARKRPITLPSCETPIFSNTKISCIVITSPSMPVISEMLVTLREPSLRRVCWTTIWIADAICWRIARSGRLVAPIAIIVSMRLSASRGVLAWTVVSEPSWPVFIACSMSSASSPRTSPTT